MLEALHINAHAARTARNRADGGFEVSGREVGLLGLGHFFELLAGDLPHLRGVGSAAALLDADRLADQHRRRRRLHDEGEAAVRVHGDNHRNRQPLLQLLSLRIELLAELHDVHTLLTQRRTNRRRRVGGARGQLELDVALYFLDHVYLSRVPAPSGSPGLIWLKVAWGAFSGHQFRFRGQKAWFLPATFPTGPTAPDR